jgi:Raf kinase inhibitor-like YbhB/YbcL family protein
MILGFLSGTATAALTVESPAFEDGGRIPAEYTCDGADSPPPLLWSAGPEGTAGYVVSLDDPAAPGRIFLHWSRWNLPSPRAGGGASTPAGARTGRNDFGTLGYCGPCPPVGHGDHRYHVRVYALDTRVKLADGASRVQLEAAMRGHVIAEGLLVGVYGRRAPPTPTR